MTDQAKTKTYLWCDTCKRSFSHSDAPAGTCPVCGGATREMGKMRALLRGIMATEMVASNLHMKHRQMVKMIWTRNGAGEQYFRVLEPDMTYGKFEKRVTDLICHGLEEGWLRLELPSAPSIDDAVYRLEFIDEDRFIRELNQLVESTRKVKS